jgi:hypothetical protein
MLEFREYNYRNEFERAVGRTRRLGLADPQVTYAVNRHWTPEQVGHIAPFIAKLFPTLDVPDLVTSCHRIHLAVLEPLENLLGCRAYLTIGSTSYPIKGQKFYQRSRVTDFKMSTRQVRRWLRDGIEAPDSRLNLHAWVTLDSMEVFDMTLPTTMGAHLGRRDIMGGVISCHPDDMKEGIRYHPFLVGEDLFRKMGALVEVMVL